MAAEDFETVLLDGQQQITFLSLAEQGFPGRDGDPGPPGAPGPPGPPGPEGPGLSNYRANVEPAGAKDGSNVTFILPEHPVGPTFELYQNGLLEDPANYSLTGNTLTLTTPPRAWWRLAASYFI